MDFSNEELAIIAILLDADEEKRGQASRKYWVHSAWSKREIEGEFQTLYKELIDDETKFHGYFRMTMNTFDVLLKIIENDLQKQDTNFRKCIPPRHRLAVCLRFLATGDSFKTISFSYRLGHSTVFEIVTNTCKALVKNLMPEVMPIPTEQKWREIADEFWNCWNFPNCIGSLDGKHVLIQAPPSSGSLYFNYKKTFSVVLMALVDAHYNFTVVDVGAYGRNSDGGIFMYSKLGKGLDRKQLNVPPDTALPGTENVAPFVILGDEAFPLKEYLMRPYPGKSLDNNSKRIYNYRHCRGRRVVENTFGILTQKFRVFNRRIQARPENADNIILATCVLHNFIKMNEDRITYSREENTNPVVDSTFQNFPMQGGNASQTAFQVRELFKDFFNSTAGSVSWQNDVIYD